MKNVDYLIVGQGLAGTFLAFQLIQKGFSVFVIDKGHKYSSSYVAAGVINPVVLKRFTITWRAKEFLNYNTSFYKSLDDFLNNKYHFTMPIHKLISSKDEENFWQHRYEKEDVKDFIYKDLSEIDSKISSTQKFKVGVVKHTSWLNISALLTDFRTHLITKDFLLEETFEFDKLTSNNYKSISFEKIVFCEGAIGKQNPLFNKLPFSLNKGQLLTIENNSLPNDVMLKKKVFVLPINPNEYKIGATYSWKWDTTNEETALAIEPEKTELLKSFLEEIITSDYKIIKEETGIRPAVMDRRPLIGRHSAHSNYYLFNGMGSRGCFMAPLLTEEFIDFVESGKPLHPEVDLNRF